MMELRSVSLEDFTIVDVTRRDAFLQMDFIYEPIIMELKKSGMTPGELQLTVDSDTFSPEDVLTGLFRLFGIPVDLLVDGDSFSYTIDQGKIEVQFRKAEERLTGVCRFPGELWEFSSSEPYIHRSDSVAGSIVILPEGDGKYYRELDKRESEEEGRLSIIGEPGKILPILDALREFLHG